MVSFFATAFAWSGAFRVSGALLEGADVHFIKNKRLKIIKQKFLRIEVM